MAGRGQRRGAGACGLWRTLRGLLHRIRKLQHLQGRHKLLACKFYNDLEIKRIQGVAQFGWAKQGFESSTGSTGEGVRDNAFRWAFVGVRVSKWGDGSSSAFGVEWREDDVLGLACDMVNKTVSFSVNGSYRPSESLSTRSLPTPLRRPSRPIWASRWLATLGSCP